MGQVTMSGVESCYMPVNKWEYAIVSYPSFEHTKYLIRTKLKINNYELTMIDIKQKICYICYLPDHLMTEYPHKTTKSMNQNPKVQFWTLWCTI